MMIREFLEQLNTADIKVWAEGDKLRCNAPKGALTPDLQAALIRRKPEILAFLDAGSTINSSLVPIQAKGSRPPFFGIPGHNGDVFCFVRLAHYLGEDQPFYGLQPPGFNGERAPLENVQELAAHYVRELREFLPAGPYFVGGYCAGGAVAFEVARQLAEQGGEVGFLALFDSPFPTAYLTRNKVANVCRYLLHRIPYHLRRIVDAGPKIAAGYVRDRVRGFTDTVRSPDGDGPAPDEKSNFRVQVANATLKAVTAYRPTVFPGRIHFFIASEESRKLNYGRQRSWREHAGGGFQLHVGPDVCTGATMLREPFAKFFAERLRECIDQRSLGSNSRYCKMDSTAALGSPVQAGNSPTGLATHNGLALIAAAMTLASCGF
ncbi:MAG: hypothetical protein LAN64_19325 [Acidobacteriia bacterium]|nr:hypothetical protein [Terriglobia bacterium]